MSFCGRWPRMLAALALATACSDLTSAGSGVVAIEVTQPATASLTVGDSALLEARALDSEGEEVTAVIRWSALDTTVSVDSTSGWVLAEAAGTGRVQARAGGLVSSPVQFTLLSRVDTLIRVAPETLDVALGEDASDPLAVRVETFSPPGPLAGQMVIYEVVLPAFADPADRTVELTGGVLIDTLVTGADGAPAPIPALLRVTGMVQPAEAEVEVRAFRGDGTDPVPGSGQRFVVRFGT